MVFWRFLACRSGLSGLFVWLVGYHCLVWLVGFLPACPSRLSVSVGLVSLGPGLPSRRMCVQYLSISLSLKENLPLCHRSLYGRFTNLVPFIVNTVIKVEFPSYPRALCPDCALCAMSSVYNAVRTCATRNPATSTRPSKSKTIPPASALRERLASEGRREDRIWPFD